MKKKTSKLLIIFILFTLFSATVVSPTQVYASKKLNYTRPNGPSPFKFKLKNFLNPQMISSVVGCTGVVNKISGAIVGLFQKNKQIQKFKKKLEEDVCFAAQIALATGLSTVFGVNVDRPVLKEDCKTRKTENTEEAALLKELIKREKAKQKSEQCLNGIAISLAKNQLVQMTRSTMNWITTGFQGDPMYIRNINSFLGNISDDIVLKELNMFKDASGNYNTTDYPYGRSYSISAIRADRSAKNIANSLKQDLTGYLPKDVTVKDFSKDFSKGGWSGWLALTQHPQNNPPGFTILASENTAKKKTSAKKEVRDQQNRSGGILDQKVCKKYTLSKNSSAGKEAASNQKDIELRNQLKKDVGDAQKDVDDALIIKNKKGNEFNSFAIDGYSFAVQKLRRAKQKLNEFNSRNEITRGNDGKECTKWETVTPGSLIKDKMSTYINSPERQLELAKTINDSLNTLFGALINKFRFNGLSSLGTGDGAFSKVSGGFGSNSLTTDIIDVQGNTASLISATPSTGGYKNDKFDLTKDLGNTYYHVTMKDLGTWDASTNKTEAGEPLYIDTTPYNSTNDPVSNAYYTVNEQGDTLLFRDGYSSWNEGDRAYFDGIHWQNWKKDILNPIKTRGIFQIQQDYIVAAKDLLKQLPGILPKIGKLDYCIPGPNPNWEANYSDNYKIFSDFVGSIKTKFREGGFLKKPSVTIYPPTGLKFTKFKAMYNGTKLWTKVKETKIWKRIYELTHLKNPKRKGGKDIARANQWIEDLNSEKATDRLTFTKEYKKIIDEKYGPNSTMQRQFIETEDTADLTKNPKWLEMSSEGLNITKNIVQYNKDVTAKAQEYKDAIAQANLNIYKLKQIGNEVSSIIQAAQDRRDNDLEALKNQNVNIIEVIAGENISKDAQIYSDKINEDDKIVVMKYNSSYAVLGITPMGKTNQTMEKGKTGTITRGNIEDWTIPVLCKDEENIDYIDNEDLITDFGGEKENRCSDGLDNDLDGLIDAKDPDCIDTYKYDTTNDLDSQGACSLSVDSEGNPIPIQYDNVEEGYNYSPDNYTYPSCQSRTSMYTCINYTYYDYNKSQLFDCNWTDTNSSGGSGGAYYGQYNFDF